MTSESIVADVVREIDVAVSAGDEKAFIDELMAAMFEPSYERNRFYPFKEYLFARLMDELRLVQGSGLRLANISKMYVDIARRWLGDLESKSVIEIGPGRHLGAGMMWKYLGASYSGVEIYPEGDFNTWVALHSSQILARLHYGSFIENFNGVDRGYVPQAGLRDSVTLDVASLVRPHDLCDIPMESSSIEYCYSNFTLEHVQDPPRLARELSRLLKPGGVTAHFIDIEDHSNFAEPFNYLVHSDEDWDAQYGDGPQLRPMWQYENRARASDFKRWFEAAGLEVVQMDVLASKPISDELLARINPRFHAYERSDIETCWLMLVARKPATA